MAADSSRAADPKSVLLLLDSAPTADTIWFRATARAVNGSSRDTAFVLSLNEKEFAATINKLLEADLPHDRFEICLLAICVAQQKAKQLLRIHAGDQTPVRFSLLERCPPDSEPPDYRKGGLSLRVIKNVKG